MQLASRKFLFQEFFGVYGGQASLVFDIRNVQMDGFSQIVRVTGSRSGAVVAESSINGVVGTPGEWVGFEVMGDAMLFIFESTFSDSDGSLALLVSALGATVDVFSSSFSDHRGAGVSQDPA